MIASTEISMSSPIMMLWLDLRVRTSTPDISPAEGIASPNKAARGAERNGQPFGVRMHVDFRFQVGSVRRRLARRSLKPQLNQIRTWVRQGRTDAWIAHQLDVSVGDIRAFKREHELAPAEAGEGETFVPGTEAEEPDLRAEDDALVAEALEAERQAEEEADTDEDAADDGPDEGDAEDGDGAAKPAARRRRGRRGGRGRSRTRKPKALEGTFDHGEEGYGLWLDPAVQDDPTYAEHWAGHRPVTVTIETDRIVISRAGEEATQVGPDGPRGTGGNAEDDD
jgi:hypothetical protein